MDLVSTLGETAALGAAGVVMWGSSSDFSSKVAGTSPGTSLPQHQSSSAEQQVEAVEVLPAHQALHLLLSCCGRWV